MRFVRKLEMILQQTLQRDMGRQSETTEGLSFFRYEGDESFTPRRRNNKITKKAFNCWNQLITNVIPKKLVKFCIKTIRARALTRRKIKNNTVYFLTSYLHSKQATICIKQLRKITQKGIKNFNLVAIATGRPEIRVKLGESDLNIRVLTNRITIKISNLRNIIIMVLNTN